MLGPFRKKNAQDLSTTPSQNVSLAAHAHHVVDLAGVDFYVQFVHWLLCEVVRAQHVDARRWSPCFNVAVRAAAVWKVGRLSCQFAAVCIAYIRRK